ncbi:MAG: hypothetical protein HQK50_05370 [Oligoflexia bacterium]|nr:hypothetical protein [Oligoflexia bacterium]
MKTITTLFFLLLFAFCLEAFADLKVGGNISSSTRGRTLPGYYLAIGSDQAGVSASSAGFQTSLGYASYYQFNAFGLFRPGTILGRKIEAGFGAGIYFYKLGYRETILDNAGTTKSSFAAGPSARVLWYFLGPAFMGIETMLGIRDLGLNLLLCYQDSTQFVLGLAF